METTMRATLVATVMIWALPGCYDPQVVDGGLACATSGACPSGYSCFQGRCWHGMPLTVDAGGGDGAGGAALMTDAGPLRVLRKLGQTCTPLNAGTSRRSSDCAEGLACLDGNNGSACFALCAAGCGACEARRVEAGGAEVDVCPLPATTCSPAPPQSGCPDTQVCYLEGERTVCDPSSGDGRATACSSSWECLPGYTCAAFGTGVGYCRPTCSVATAACPPGTVCQATSGTFSYCY